MKNKRGLTLIILSGILIMLIILKFSSGEKKPAQGKLLVKGKISPQGKFKEKLDLGELLKEKPKFIYEKAGRRDPFVSLIKKGKVSSKTKETTGSDLTVTGILWDTSDPLAEIEIKGVLGKRIVHKGDLVKEGKVIRKDKAEGIKGGEKVLDIQRDKIIVLKGGKKITLKLKGIKARSYKD